MREGGERVLRAGGQASNPNASHFLGRTKKIRDWLRKRERQGLCYCYLLNDNFTYPLIYFLCMYSKSIFISPLR